MEATMRTGINGMEHTVKDCIKKGVYKNRMVGTGNLKLIREEEQRIMREFKADLFAEFEVDDNPRAEEAYQIAVTMGMKNGLNGIYEAFERVAQLIR